MPWFPCLHSAHKTLPHLQCKLSGDCSAYCSCPPYMTHMMSVCTCVGHTWSLQSSHMELYCLELIKELWGSLDHPASYYP